MPTLSKVIGEHTSLTPVQHEYLRRLVAEWHLIADLDFADLVLWVPDEDPNMLWAAAQIRPVTGPTALPEDLLGDLIAYQPENLVSEAYLSAEPVVTSDNRLASGHPVSSRAIPIRMGDDVIGVVERITNQFSVRAPSTMEDAYLEIGEVLEDMLFRGYFPLPGDKSDPSVSPHIGDGLIRVSSEGDVTYASPNAISAYRRLGYSGDLVDEDIFELTSDLLAGETQQADSAIALLLEPVSREFDLRTRSIDLRVRTMPLIDHGEPDGMLILVRNVTDLRARERQLVTKDATIREIHHRVKNNLQTVAALLRMQARRMQGGEARAALQEAMSRVAAIAAVHEMLSQSYDEEVDFDTVADKILRIVGDVSATNGEVRVVREGSFGKIPANAATGLALVVTELCQNAIEHGFDSSGGYVRVVPVWEGQTLVVQVIDEGQGLPADFSLASSRSLGLSIVETLTSDLGGVFDLRNNPDGPGSRAVVRLPLGAGGPDLG